MDEIDYEAHCTDTNCPMAATAHIAGSSAGLDGCTQLVAGVQRISPDVAPEHWDAYLNEYKNWSLVVNATQSTLPAPTWGDWSWRDDYQFWVLRGRPTNWACGEQL